MAHKLVIVESPGEGAHDRGLPRQRLRRRVVHRPHPRPAQTPPPRPRPSIKDKPWGRLAVDVDNDFEPYYVVPRDKKSADRQAQEPAQGRRRALPRHRRGPRGRGDRLAPARRAEAEGIPVHRMVFHEITKPAILAAVANPREINDDLVEAQEARRILDRLYGYEVSPGAVEEGHVRPVRRAGAVGRDPAGRRPRARADGVPRRVVLGPRGHLRRRRRQGARGCSRPSSTRSTTTRVAGGSRLRRRTASSRTSDRRPGPPRPQPPPRALVAALRDTSFAVRSVESKPYRRRPTRRSAPPRCSRRPAASSA